MSEIHDLVERVKDQKIAELAAALKNERLRYSVIRDFLLSELEWENFRTEMLRNCRSEGNFIRLSKWLAENPESDPRPEQEILSIHDAAVRKPLLEALRRAVVHIPYDVSGTTYWEEDDGTRVTCEWFRDLKAVLARYNPDGSEK